MRDDLEQQSVTLDRLAILEGAQELSPEQADKLAARRTQRALAESRIQANTDLLQKKGELFGQGKLASGYRTTREDHALDWAIAEPLPERRGGNKVR